jgi:hypothetical protein
MFLGTRNNENLEQELESSYKDGMLGFYARLDNNKKFKSEVFNPFKQNINSNEYNEKMGNWDNEIEMVIHSNEINNIADNYLKDWN